MQNILKVFLVFLLFTGCFNQKREANKNQEKLTFIFDFDATMYNHVKNGSYVDMFYESAFKGSGCERNEVQTWIAKNLHLVNSPEGVNQFMRKLDDKFHIKVSQKDADYAVSELNKVQTTGLKDVILKLKSQGHQVLIIGGGTWGCAIIPNFAKQFGIEKDDIYSGYFKDFSINSLHKTFTCDNFEYVNCAKPDTHTVYSYNKSDLIKLLKNQNKIKGKVIHIGDGENDLEVWQAKQADAFVGFGVNRYSKKVEAGSEIYVKTMDEFKIAIDNILFN